MAPVCRFWPNCKYGDRCKFEHPSGRNAQQNNNRFAALDHYSPNDRNSGYQSGGGSYNQSSSYGGASTTATQPYNLDKKQIISDLTAERPQWILSAYGPGRQAPGQLFGGPFREQSFEEMRLLHYMGLASGNPQQAVQEAEALVQASEQQIKSALDDVDGAIKFITNAENEHPNRIDIVRDSQPTTSAASPTPSLFGQPSIQASNSFGAPSQPSSTNVFGAPSQPSTSAFGAPSSTATVGTFGKPSTIGQKPNPFGAPSRSAFGAPSQLGTSGTFGQPSALGQTANPFGAPSGSSGFGQPSSLGQKSNAFGVQGTPSVGAFGQPTVLGSKPNPFGAQSGPAAATTAPFSLFAGTTTAFGQPPQSSNPFDAPSQPSKGVFGLPSQPSRGPLFGQPSSPAQPFGQPAESAANPFSAPVQAQTNSFGTAGSLASGAVSQPVSTNPFGAPSQPTGSVFGAPSITGIFGQPSVPTVTSNPFGKPNSNPTASLSNGPASNSFGGLSQSSTNGTVAAKPYNPNATYTHPPLESYSSKDGSGKLTMFKGKRVAYRNGEAGTIESDGSWSKIWFPEGPPPLKKDTEMEDSAYDDAIKKSYMHARETGSFLNGVMPLVPPKREWCLWDF